MAGPRTNRHAVTASPSARARPAAAPVPAPAPAQELGQTQHSGAGAGVPVPQASAQERSNQALLAKLDPSHPQYVGPGYVGYTGEDGMARLVLQDPQANAEWKARQSRIDATGTAAPRVPTLQDLQNAVNPTVTMPAQPLTIQQRLGQAQAAGVGGFQSQLPAGGLTTRQIPISPQTTAALAARTAPLFSSFDLGPAGAAGGAGGAVPTSANPEAAGAPADMDRARIDALLGNVSKATSGVMGLANLDQRFSEAQAQLQQGLAAGQAQSLSLARSGSRRDAASNMARALQANSEMAGEASRSSAILRANEEAAERQLKLDAFKAAGDLGLNAAALELDANRIDMEQATNYLNQLFETNRLGLQLDEAEAQRVTNFIRDMALIEKDYHALSLQEQAAIRDDLTRRYGISENTRLGLEQLAAQGEVNWGQLGANFLMGLGSGAAAGGMALLSDRRMKTDVRDTTEDDLDELLGSLRSQTYRYTGARGAKGTHLGFMAQDLKRSRLGAAMVDETSDGTLIVDGGKAAGAALSGLVKVYDKLKQLEASL
jgi:hypothetical protein